MNHSNDQINAMTARPMATHAALVAAALLIAACGGGGNDSGGAAAPTAATPSTPAPAPAPAPAPTTTGSTCSLTDFAAAALTRINELRAAGADCRTKGRFGPAAALGWNAQLTQAAERHSQDMVAHNFFSHTGSDGSTLAVRVDATGYAWQGLGENIAAGYPSVDAVMTGWMASDGHCENLMNPSYNEVGLVCVPGTSATSYNTYWTMDLAKSR
jgi:uncharacterized protein YkwD